MDAHFDEYLGAIAGMHDVYGERGDEHPSEFHETAVTPAEPVVALDVEPAAATSA